MSKCLFFHSIIFKDIKRNPRLIFCVLIYHFQLKGFTFRFNFQIVCASLSVSRV